MHVMQFSLLRCVAMFATFLVLTLSGEPVAPTEISGPNKHKFVQLYFHTGVLVEDDIR